MLGQIMRAFRPLDTTEVDRVIAAASRTQREVRVRARALRMDVACGDPTTAFSRMRDQVIASAGHLLRALYDPVIDEPVPQSMQRLLDKL